MIPSLARRWSRPIMVGDEVWEVTSVQEVEVMVPAAVVVECHPMATKVAI